MSRHQNTRVYHGANKVFRSDDRGNTWRAISPDLSRGVDRNRLPIMGRIWSVDAVAKNGSTDIFGQTTSIAESALDENLLWVGTDDGLLWLTRDGGKNWEKMDNLPGVPNMSYVHQVIASEHDKNTAYICYNHHRYGDFKPYLLKTTDGGKNWTSLAATLPERGSVYTIAEDHIDRNLLFCGTEFGAFFSNDGGSNWTQLKAGLPTIAVRDMDIQRRENDLVLATFGRGFYILDDYSALRNLKKENFDTPATIFPIKDALHYVAAEPLGLRSKGHLGSSHYAAENPPVGAVFTYYVKDELKTLKAKRQEAEKAKSDQKQPVYYPSMDSLRIEDEQPEPYLLFTITDASGEVVRHIKAPAKKGMQRLTWDLKHNTAAPVNARRTPAPDQLFGSAETGYLAFPGEYRVQLSKYEDGVLTTLTQPVPFKVKSLQNSSLPATNLAEAEAFYKQMTKLRKAVGATNSIRGELNSRLANVQTATLDLSSSNAALLKQIYDTQRRLNDVNRRLNGDNTRARREYEIAPGITERLSFAQESMSRTTAAPTETAKEALRLASKELTPTIKELKSIANAIEEMEKTLEMKGAPYTPGRWPSWSDN